jgi:hypothetical protein
MLLLGLLFSFLFSTGPDGIGKEGYSIDYPSQETSRSVSEFSNAFENSFTLRRENTNVSYPSTLRKVSELSADFTQTISFQFFKTSFTKWKIFKRSLDISLDILIFIGVLRI